MIKLIAFMVVVQASGATTYHDSVDYFDSNAECVAAANEMHVRAQEASNMYNVKIKIETECAANDRL